MKRAAAFPGARLFLACAALACAAIAGAATGVPAWEQTFRRNLTGAGNQKPLAARERRSCSKGACSIARAMRSRSKCVGSI